MASIQSAAPPSKKGHVQSDAMEGQEELNNKVIAALLELRPSLGPFEELTARQVTVVTALRNNKLPSVNTMKAAFLDRELALRSNTSPADWPKLSGQEKAAMIQTLRQEQDLEEELQPQKVPCRKPDLVKQVCARGLLNEAEANKKTVGVLQLMLRTDQPSVNIQRTLSQSQSSTGAPQGQGYTVVETIQLPGNDRRKTPSQQ